MKYVWLASALLLFSGLATPFAPRRLPPRQLTLRINDQPVAADTAYSRISVESGNTLRLNILRADDPDGEGLTILIDRFPLKPGKYAFQDILSGHNRDASYRYDIVSAYSKSCTGNPGTVVVTAVDTEHHLLRGTYSCQLCEVGRGARRFTMAGSFWYPYEEY